MKEAMKEAIRKRQKEMFEQRMNRRFSELKEAKGLNDINLRHRVLNVIHNNLHPFAQQDKVAKLSELFLKARRNIGDSNKTLDEIEGVLQGIYIKIPL